MHSENSNNRNKDWVEIQKSKITEIKNIAISRYHKIMGWYSDILDKVWISPNQIVTGRVAAGILLWAAMQQDDIWTLNESLLLLGLGVSFFHDAVDGYHARNTQQTSILWEKLDALWDKILMFPLIAILLCFLDTNPSILGVIIPLLWVAIATDVKSSVLRWENIKALQACLQKPLTQDERKNNPNAKSKNAAVSAGKAKTGVMMTWVTLAYAHNILWFSDNATWLVLLGTLTVSNVLSILSLKTKGVTLENFFKKEVE